MQRDLARGKKIAADVLAEVAGTPLDKGVVLDELAQKRKAAPVWSGPKLSRTCEAD